MPLKLRNRQKTKMFDSVTERIKNQTQGGLKVNPETGVRYEEPLEEKHPGLTIGLMAAQPGTILEKVLAPSVYKGMAKSIGEGNLSEALMAGIAPVKGVSLTRVPESAWAEMLHEEAIAEAGALKNRTLGSSKFRPMPSKPITEAEKLGIPKSERSNPKSLENSQYWGYKQWNDRYNAAIESGNIVEAQRLRDLHGIVKANGKKPFVTWRGESKEGAKNFNLGTSPQRPGVTFTSEQPHIAASYTDVPNPYSKIEGFARQKEQRLKWIDNARKLGMLDSEQELLANQELQLLQEKINQANSEIIAGYTHPQLRKLYIYSNNPAYFDAKGAHWRHIGKDTVTGHPMSTDQLAVSIKNSGNDVLVIKNVRDQGNVSMNSPVSTDIIGFNQKRIKLTDPITYDDAGKVIPIVKRDNFWNPNIRYKRGGKLKHK